MGIASSLRSDVVYEMAGSSPAMTALFDRDEDAVADLALDRLRQMPLT
jgi:hypothetical protein